MRPSRRAVLTGALAAVAAGAVTGAAAHTPYGQWVVYRQKHLLVGSHRGDMRTYALAKSVAAALDAELPEARARVARGPRPQRIASLMGTGQLEVAVLSVDEAVAMTLALPPFGNYRPTALAALADLGGGYGLVAAARMPEDHAWLVAGALGHSGLGQAPGPDPLPLHPGAAAFWEGEPKPA